MAWRQNIRPIAALERLGLLSHGLGLGTTALSPRGRWWRAEGARRGRALDAIHSAASSPESCRRGFRPPLTNIRPLRAADVVEVLRLLARAVGLWLPIEKLGVDAVLLNQVIDTVLTFAAALVALDAQHVELADNVTEDDRAIAGHQSPTFPRSCFGIRLRGADASHSSRLHPN